jgi:hypothetical protein
MFTCFPLQSRVDRLTPHTESEKPELFESLQKYAMIFSAIFLTGCYGPSGEIEVVHTLYFNIEGEEEAAQVEVIFYSAGEYRYRGEVQQQNVIKLCNSEELDRALKFYKNRYKIEGVKHLDNGKPDTLPVEIDLTDPDGNHRRYNTTFEEINKLPDRGGVDTPIKADLASVVGVECREKP